MIQHIKTTLKRRLPTPWVTFYRSIRLYPDDLLYVVAYLLRGWPSSDMDLLDRLNLLRRLYRITFNIDCPHTQSQILAALEAIIAAPIGCVVEAGCYKGGSTAKFSIGAKMMGRRLFAFDSFQGIPDNVEPHDRTIDGRQVGYFQAGSYCGTLNEVMQSIQEYGEIEVCEFVPGWFEDTMPGFTEEIGVVYLDVDLASSTRTCLKYLYPLLVPGGVLFSQDGHLPLVIEVFDDDEFWEHEVGCNKPPIQGLSLSPLIRLVKPE